MVGISADLRRSPSNSSLRQDARRCAGQYTKEHVNLAKGLPALIMSWGSMQVLAFCRMKRAAPDEAAARR